MHKISLFFLKQNHKLPKFILKSTTGLVFLHSPNFNRGRGPKSAGWALQGDPGNPAGPAGYGPTPTPPAFSLAFPVLCVGTVAPFVGTQVLATRGNSLTCADRRCSQLQHSWAGVPRGVRRSGKTPMFRVVAAHRTKATDSFSSLD